MSLSHAPPPPNPAQGPATNPPIPKWCIGAKGWPIYQLCFKTWFELSTFTAITNITKTTVNNVYLNQIVQQNLVNILPTKSMGPFLNDSTYLYHGFEIWLVFHYSYKASITYWVKSSSIFCKYPKREDFLQQKLISYI